MKETDDVATTELKPGETIHPGATLPAPEPAVPSTDEKTDNTIAEAPVAAQGSFDTPVPQPPTVADDSDPERINWTASEYIEHAKSIDWYLGLAVAAILTAAALYLFFKDIVTSAAILVAALAFGFYGRRQPRQLQYQLDSHGLTIADKFLPYAQFRSFAIMEEGAFASIALLPLKRFGLLTTIYLDPQDEDAIIGLLNQHLPLEPREHDPIDRLMNRIRF